MGFEPTPPKRLVPKTSALDRSAIQPVPAPAAAGRTGVRFGQNKKLAPAGNQTRVSSVAGTYTITVLPAHDNVSVPRLELGISRVLGERHNQLDHTDGGKTKNGVSGFRSQYLVLAKDARFRLRQYPTPSRRRLARPTDSPLPDPTSSRPASCMLASIAQLAEHALSKRKVASSILAGGSPTHPSWCSW